VINSENIVVGQMRKCPITLDLLLSCNTVLHFVIMKQSALRRIGLLNSNYEARKITISC